MTDGRGSMLISIKEKRREVRFIYSEKFNYLW